MPGGCQFKTDRAVWPTNRRLCVVSLRDVTCHLAMHLVFIRWSNSMLKRPPPADHCASCASPFPKFYFASFPKCLFYSLRIFTVSGWVRFRLRSALPAIKLLVNDIALGLAWLIMSLKQNTKLMMKPRGRRWSCIFIGSTFRSGENVVGNFIITLGTEELENSELKFFKNFLQLGWLFPPFFERFPYFYVISYL